MSWLASNSQLLGRCANCLAHLKRPLPRLAARDARFRPDLRRASAVAKPRAASATSAVPREKKTKTSTASEAPTSAPKAAARTKRAGRPPGKETPPTETRFAVSRKTARAPAARSLKKKKVAAEEDEEDEVRNSSTTSTTTSTTTTANTNTITINSAGSPGSVIPPVVPEAAVTSPRTAPFFAQPEGGAPPPPPQPPTPPTPPKMADRSSPEYKRTARRVLAVMVAVPFFLVTSYHLFDRMVLGNKTKTWDDYRAEKAAQEAQFRAWEAEIRERDSAKS